MSLILSLLGGMSAKAYDDLKDNMFLRKFSNETFMEFLKGFHYISLTTASIKEPLFFIMQYVANVFNHFGNKDAYSAPYEHSLLYSFALLFFIIDYKNIKQLSMFDMLLVTHAWMGMLLEPAYMYYFFNNSEVSFEKMILRSSFAVGAMLGNFFAESMTLKHWYCYAGGYCAFSALVQYYSLMSMNEEDEIKEKEKETKETKKQKNKKTKKQKKQKNNKIKKTKEHDTKQKNQN
jgi:hypothetical protein